MNHFASWRRRTESRHLPQGPTNLGERIDESRQGLVVPGRMANPRFLALPALVGHQGDEREQPQQRWGCSGNGEVGPLPLGFYAQVEVWKRKGYETPLS